MSLEIYNKELNGYLTKSYLQITISAIVWAALTVYLCVATWMSQLVAHTLLNHCPKYLEIQDI